MRSKAIMGRVLSAVLAVTLLGSGFGLSAWAVDGLWIDPVLLAGTDGGVSVSGSGGRSMSLQENMALSNGSRVTTAADSYAWLTLFGVQTAKLGPSGQAEMRQTDAALEILLQPGTLFFNTTLPLEEERTLTLRAATAAADIRSASGWMKVIDRWNAQLYVLSGSVACSVADPVTGQRKSAVVGSGQAATMVVYPQDRQGDKCDILLEGFSPADIDGYVMTELAGDPDLCGRIYSEADMDPLPPLGLLGSALLRLAEVDEHLLHGRQLLEENNDKEGARAQMQAVAEELEQLAEELGTDLDLSEARQALEDDDLTRAAQALAAARQQLEDAQRGAVTDAQTDARGQAADRQDQDEQAAREQQQAIDEQAEQLESNTSGTDAWVPTPSPSPSPSPSPRPSGGGTSFVPPPVRPSPTTGVTKSLVMGSFTQEELQELLNDPSVSEVVIQPSSDPADNVLDLEGEFTVPEGLILRFNGEEDEITVNVAEDAVFNVEGGVSLPNGTVNNSGAIHVAAGSTLATGEIQNGASGTITVAEDGTITADTITNDGKMTTAGTVNGVITTSGDMQVTGGTLSNRPTQTGGTLTVSGGTLEKGIDLSGGELTVSGGEVRGGILQTDGEDVPSNAVITGGTITGGYYYDPTNCDESSLTVEGGSIVYDAEQTVGAGAALTAAGTVGTVTVSDGVIDGGELPAVSTLPTGVDVTAGGNIQLKSEQLPPVTANSKVVYNKVPVASDCIVIVTCEDGVYTLAGAYATLAEALAAAQAGQIVALLADTEVPGAAGATVTGGTMDEPVVLDLNGKKLTLKAGPITVAGTPDTERSGALSVLDSAGGGKLVSDWEKPADPPDSPDTCVFSLTGHGEYDDPGTEDVTETWTDYLTLQAGLDIQFKTSRFILDRDGEYVLPAGLSISEEPNAGGYHTLAAASEPEPTDAPAPTTTPGTAASSEAGDGQADATDPPEESPEPTDTAQPTETPGATEEPQPSDGPDAEQTPAPTDGPDVKETPGPEQTDEPAETDAPADTPAPTDTPVPSDTPAPTETSAPGTAGHKEVSA